MLALLYHCGYAVHLGFKACNECCHFVGFGSSNDFCLSLRMLVLDGLGSLAKFLTVHYGSLAKKLSVPIKEWPSSESLARRSPFKRSCSICPCVRKRLTWHSWANRRQSEVDSTGRAPRFHSQLVKDGSFGWSSPRQAKLIRGILSQIQASQMEIAKEKHESAKLNVTSKR